MRSEVWAARLQRGRELWARAGRSSPEPHGPSLPLLSEAEVGSSCSCQGRAFAGLPTSCQLSPCQEHFLGGVLFPARTDLGLFFPSQHLMNISVG